LFGAYGYSSNKAQDQQLAESVEYYMEDEEERLLAKVLGQGILSID
jgi:hypothetical protein